MIQKNGIRYSRIISMLIEFMMTMINLKRRL